jgi:eukaryotic-like serine/threonine-protein kinase
MGLRIGDEVDGKFRIVGRLGEGGMGTVYEAVHSRIHRRVAIKVLKESLADEASMVQRFQREAQAAGRIGSPHIAEVHDVGRLSTGEHYMILEYLDGESLSERIRRVGRMTPDELFPLLVQLLDGLEAAHQADIVHRDLKPANVFLVGDRKGYDTFVKVLDFGVSKFRELGDGEGFTQTGTIVGTPHYMAPELTKGARHADCRSDVYATGAVAYRALAGRPPYRGDTIHELLTRLITEPPDPLRDIVPDIDPEAAALVHRALVRDPSARWSTAQAFAEAVRVWLEERGLSPEGRSSMTSLTGLASGPGSMRRPSEPSRAPMRAPLTTDPRERATVVDRPSSRPNSSKEPWSVLTPSPSIYDSKMFRSSTGSKLGWLVAGVAILVVLLGVATRWSSPEPEPAPTTRAATRPPASMTAAPSATTPSTANAEPSAEPSASASVAVTASPPSVRPRIPRRPEREIRTDL